MARQEKEGFPACQAVPIGGTRFPVLNEKEIREGFQRLQTRRSGGFSAAMTAVDPTATLAARVRGVRYLIRQRTFGP